jgi:alcohol dehydrogenase class IV
MMVNPTVEQNTGTGAVVHERLSALPGVLDTIAAKRVLIVGDRQAMAASGAEPVIESACRGRRAVLFDRFEPNPTIDALRDGVRECRQLEADTVLAVGGGTAIDLAKLIRFCDGDDADPLDAIERGPGERRPRAVLIAAPTTAGTGSEATHFAVVYVDRRKRSVAHPMMRPDHAIVDPALTYSMPPRLTAQTGLDAFCQAIESSWSVRATDASRAWAGEAIELAWAHLHGAVHRPAPVNRTAMSRAAHLAGRAIDVSRTTACHALSYAITMRYGVPHGAAVALTLAPMLAFNAAVTAADCADPRGPDAVRLEVDQIAHRLGCGGAGEAAAGITRFIASLGCPTRLAEIGVRDDAGIVQLIREANAERLGNNPRRLPSDDIGVLLRSIL